ncbi:MAG: hypothetical protein JKY37_20380 [Nannocystaceae bacterium]|nr:hypothetical protein [Nannocystaceae bacterium]
MVELQAIPAEIQAELDLVLQPINDVDVVIDQVTSIPTRYGLDAASLTAMAKASMSDGTVSVEIDVNADAKAEIETMLKTVNGIAVGLKETPARVKTATGNIIALGAKATGIVAKVTAKLQAKLANPLLKADAKVSIQADLDLVVGVNAEIKAMIGDAQQTVSSLPAKGTEALAKLTAAFAGGASAG